MNTETTQASAFAGVDKATLATAAALPANPAPGAAPAVEPVRIDALVASLTYETAHVPGTNTDVATARLPGGFVVCVGENHMISAASYDAERGRTNAIDDAATKARAKLWEFEGYALYLRLEQMRAAGIDPAMPAHQQRVMLEKIELDERIEKLAAFLVAPYFAHVETAEQERLTEQLHLMRALSAVLGYRIAAFQTVQA